MRASRSPSRSQKHLQRDDPELVTSPAGGRTGGGEGVGLGVGVLVGLGEGSGVEVGTMQRWELQSAAPEVELHSIPP